ncbi:MAG: rod shape-determining protein MreC [Verrucomicrobiota bacterium]|jgi:rod shape-determining protein MreC|nr:rod shape-determining protein MreC [Verrucomicrobiota bacterium]
MLKRPHYIALGLAALLTLMVLNLPARATERLKLAIGSIFVPLFGLTSTAQQLPSSVGNLLITRKELLRQNEVLRIENQQLKLQEARAENIERENARLRQIVGWQHQRGWKMKLGRVILREPANWWRSVQIDLGAREGISNNLPVITIDGFLVGRTASVGLTRCQVLLVGDPNCRVSARVENEARDTGVIGPAGPLEREFVELGYLSRNAILKPGQDIVTSGLGGIFPKDVPVGKIVDSHQIDFGFQTLARVRLGANLNSLEEVWVLLEK